ncbi:MAG: DUF998 domain-containing protein [Bacteroidales bacterium]|nr:DUF998 domain-containing protein [Bacteroidales bacterium]
MNKTIFDLIFLIGSIAVIGDFLIPALISRGYPNYCHLRNTISTLGTNKSPVKKQASIWLISLGTLFIIFGIGQNFLFNDLSWKHYLYIWGIIAFGIGAGIIAGIYPEDSKGVKETKNGKIHGIGAGFGFVFLLFNPLIATGITEFNGLEWFNSILFIIGMLTFQLFLLSGKKKNGILSFSGLWQKLNLFVLYSPLLINYVASKHYSTQILLGITSKQ